MTEMDPRLVSPNPTPNLNPSTNTSAVDLPTADSAPVVATVATKDHLLTNKLYDIIHFIAVILLPAIGTLYFALADIFHLPAGEQVVGAITAVDLFLGGLIGVSNASYNSSTSKYAGQIEIAEQAGKKIYSLVMNDDPELIDQMESVVFKVKKAN